LSILSSDVNFLFPLHQLEPRRTGGDGRIKIPPQVAIVSDEKFVRAESPPTPSSPLLESG
jgi:hypothetical protein